MTRLEKEREALEHLYATCSDYSKAPLASRVTLLALIERVENSATFTLKAPMMDINLRIIVDPPEPTDD